LNAIVAMLGLTIADCASRALLSAKKCIADGMAQHIGISLISQTSSIRNFERNMLM